MADLLAFVRGVEQLLWALVRLTGPLAILVWCCLQVRSLLRKARRRGRRGGLRRAGGPRAASDRPDGG